MVRRKRRPRRDNWGRKPDDPFLRRLYEDPERAARLQTGFTIGLILFWISVVLGLLIVFYIMVFGS